MKLKSLNLGQVKALILKPIKPGYKVKFRLLKEHHAYIDDRRKLIVIDSLARDRLVRYFIHEKLHYLGAEEDDNFNDCSTVVQELEVRILKKLTSAQRNGLLRELASLIPP